MQQDINLISSQKSNLLFCPQRVINMNLHMCTRIVKAIGLQTFQQLKNYSYNQSQIQQFKLALDYQQTDQQ